MRAAERASRTSDASDDEPASPPPKKFEGLDGRYCIMWILLLLYNVNVAQRRARQRVVDALRQCTKLYDAL